MDKKYIFSCIISKQDKGLINSILNQTLAFEDNVQLILTFDDFELKNAYPENVVICPQLNQLEINGKYIIFIDEIIPENLLKDANDFISLHDDIKLIKISNDYEKQIINVENDFKHSLLDINSTFIHVDLIENLDECDDLFINKLLIDIAQYGTIPANLEKTVTNNFAERCNLYRSLIRYSRNNPSKYMQYAIIEDISLYLLQNEYTDINDILQHIDTSIIRKHSALNQTTSKFLIYIKNNDFHYEIQESKLFLKSNQMVLNGLHDHKIGIDIVDIKKGFLNISGRFVSFCDSDYLNFEAVVKNQDGSEEIFIAHKNEYPTTFRKRHNYLGIDWKFYPCFDFKIPFTSKSNFKINLRIRFAENSDETFIYPKISLKEYSGLSSLSNFFIKSSKIVLFKDNAIHLVDSSFLFKMKLYAQSISNIYKSKEEHAGYSIFIHLTYIILSFFWANKRIWLFADRPTVADDNAKHLFKYSIAQKDNIEKYYILKKESPDFKEMKKMSKNIVAMDSFKHKMLYLFAEKYISSHKASTINNPFTKINHKLFSGLITVEMCFIQHGITMHDVSYWLKKFDSNFFLFVTASELERNSIIHPNYNYTEEEVKTLGFPRYDNLSNDDLKKQILFMPTWRKKLLDDEDEFLKSSYFRGINEFLNNKKLHDLLEKYGFKIKFKPHFELLKVIDLFDIPDNVILSIDEPYQELFNKSMLLVTDYSSVFFDFAYLKKPVIYFRGDNEKFHYDSGYFDFEKMGFGEITTSMDELIPLIKSYLENGCEMEDKYIKRVDEFFKYTDKNNCKRVYDWLYENK